jgi:probable phosphoglycerate mutase
VTECSVVLVRHGETAWSKVGRHTGRTDIPLSPEGRADAAALAPRLAGLDFRLALTSPLRRARDTADLIGHPDAQRDADLVEWDYGDYDGLTTVDIHRTRPDWSLWRDGTPGGESVADVGARVDRVIARLRALDGAALLVAHGHLLRVLAARWLGLPPDGGRLLALSASSVSVIGWERDTPVVRLWNDVAHLSVSPELS